MQAVGGYIRGLREGNSLSLKAVERLLRDAGVNVNASTVSKIEHTEHHTSLSTILALVRVLNGRISDVWMLATSQDATVEDGERLGRTIAREKQTALTDEEIAVLEQLTPDQRKAALALFRQMLPGDLPPRE